VITTPHVAGSTAEAQEELGTQVAVQVRDYLVEGVIRNAVNLPALSPEQYRRVRPYLALAERLGSLVSQAAATRPARIRIRYAGEVAEVGTHLLRSAVLAGMLNAILHEKVNVVNAAGRCRRARAHRRRGDAPPRTRLPAHPGSFHAARQVRLARIHRGRHGGARWFAARDSDRRIPLEAQLDGTVLFLRNQDQPGVIGHVGSTLGKHGVNIATFALGRRDSTPEPKPFR